MSDFISLSDCTVIGYTYRDERIRDELISNISYKEIEINSSSFSLKNFVRDYKINSIFDESDSSNVTHFLLNINDVIIPDGVTRSGMLKSTYIKHMITDIRESLSKTNYKLIVLSRLNKSIMGGSDYLSGGEHILYMCDLAYAIKDGVVNIIKNRYGPIK